MCLLCVRIIILIICSDLVQQLLLFTSECEYLFLKVRQQFHRSISHILFLFFRFLFYLNFCFSYAASSGRRARILVSPDLTDLLLAPADL